MNKLVLTESFQIKLSRLSASVGDLTYSGADFASYEGLPVVAIVGTRKPTPYGKMMTEKLAEELARAGVVVVSGNALGVDEIAQSSALKANGRVIAVLPSGLDNIYPATNKPVTDRILKANGTLLTEFEPGHIPMAHDFLHRNRIVAALSDLVVIPEAAARSGSLNTAKHAMNMRIPVCVVPGNVTSPMSSGTNQLLKQGAHAVTETADILRLLGIDVESKQTQLNLIGETPEETIILEKIGLGITDSESLQAQTALSTIEFQSAITMLEVAGRIAQNSLGSWHLK
jgi:DNA processing protein